MMDFNGFMNTNRRRVQVTKKKNIYIYLYMSIPRFALRDKVTLRLLKLLFLGSGCSRVV
jgi:hypothetical protein